MACSVLCSAALLALAMSWQPDPAALVPLYRQALAAREKQFGPDHPKVARQSGQACRAGGIP